MKCARFRVYITYTITTRHLTILLNGLAPQKEKGGSVPQVSHNEFPNSHNTHQKRGVKKEEQIAYSPSKGRCSSNFPGINLCDLAWPWPPGKLALWSPRRRVVEKCHHAPIHPTSSSASPPGQRCAEPQRVTIHLAWRGLPSPKQANTT